MTTTKINHPATKTFVTALIAECKAKGYTISSLDPTTESGLHENGGWCFLRLGGDAALLVPKAKGRLGNLHSHVDLSGKDGYVPHPVNPNGKIVCHFAPDIEKVKKVLPAFLSAAKRATKAPTPKATVVAPVSAPVNPLLAEPTEEELDILAPMVSQESWAELADSEEEAYQTVA